MLFITSILLILVASMHSFVGGRRLIDPLCRNRELPIILGSIERTRLTLRVGWHALSVTWAGTAIVLGAAHFGRTELSALFLWANTGTFAALGLAALILSQGRHLSWIMFLPIATLLGITASTQ